jgi:hypothetical protein
VTSASPPHHFLAQRTSVESTDRNWRAISDSFGALTRRFLNICMAYSIRFPHRCALHA